MKSEVEKIIEKELTKYKIKEIRIFDKKYPLYIVPEFCDEDLNVFEGFLFVKARDKSEVSYLKTRYKPPVSGYTPRLAFILYEGYLLIKDYRRNRHIIKTLKKISKTFLNKLKKALSEPEEENLNKLFDRTDVIEEFYILYKKTRECLLKNIKGIPEEEKREEFVDNFMMQMLTLWYLQERGFFNNDKNYFITKFKELKQKKLFNGFKNYYEFLTYLFDKISGHEDKQYYEDEITGKVVVVGPAVFLNGEHSKAISIPDKCFYKEGVTDILINTPPKKVSQEVPLLNLFESRDWTEGNIDEFVLGAIYEKLITYMERKKLGAYYTPEEITSYICKNTVEPYLVDRVNEKFKKNFEAIDQVIESNDKEIILHLFEQLKEIKILDPAVGSAHFLESAIDVLVRIYEKIWEKAKELGIRKGLEIVAADEKGEIKRINLLEIDDEDRFKLLVKFFIILSKNIYGVDINPSALKVARARLFLTLAKHFRVGREKDIFIRFPNVHFNLREGNSLIGYVELGKEENKGQLRLDLFVKEEQADYITEKIKVVAELEEYLEKIAKSLNLDDNIVKEIEKLNRILSKKKINWEDFEKVLKTKEKLIRILIASLNSKYAKPLNDLLREITDLFNQKLDEKFAEEHGINLDDLKKIKTFHWIFEFPEVFLKHNPGFDVVIGNPPYLDSEEMSRNTPIYRTFLTTLYDSARGNWDIFCVFVERSLILCKDNGYFSMILPNKLLSAEYSKYIRKIIIDNAVLIIRDYSRVAVFPSNVYPIVIIVHTGHFYRNVLKAEVIDPKDYTVVFSRSVRQESLNPNDSWAFIFESTDEIIDYIRQKSNPLASVKDIEILGAATVSEAYKISKIVSDCGQNFKINDYFLFINSGIIDRYISLWGEKQTSYIKKKFHKPVIQRNKLLKISINRYNQAIRKKVIIAGLTKNLEAYFDIGIFLAGKSTTIITAKEDSKYLTFIINSQLMTYFYKKYYKSLSLQSGYLRIGPPQIRELPMIKQVVGLKNIGEKLTDYLLFLNATKERREKLKEIINFFDRQITDSLVYELYFKEKFYEDGLYPEPKEYLLEMISKHLKPINYDRYSELYWKKQLEGKLSKKEENELRKLEEENLKVIKEVIKKIKDDRKIMEQIEKIKSHEWVRIIEGRK